MDLASLEFPLEPPLTDSSNPAGPNLGERVRVEGYDRPFFVARVDEERREVDLVPVTGSAPCLEAVPIAKLRRNRVS
jgi:hypothetical protein